MNTEITIQEITRIRNTLGVSPNGFGSVEWSNFCCKLLEVIDFELNEAITNVLERPEPDIRLLLERNGQGVRVLRAFDHEPTIVDLLDVDRISSGLTGDKMKTLLKEKECKLSNWVSFFIVKCEPKS